MLLYYLLYVMVLNFHMYGCAICTVLYSPLITAIHARHRQPEIVEIEIGNGKVKISSVFKL